MMTDWLLWLLGVNVVNCNCYALVLYWIRGVFQMRQACWMNQMSNSIYLRFLAFQSVVKLARMMIF
jgi:hypothetical protein